MSAPINSLLLFSLGLVCATPLLSSAPSVAAPREVFQGRKLLSVEPGNKVRCEYEMVGWRWEAGMEGPPCRATWAGGCGVGDPLGGSWGIFRRGTEHALLLSQPFTRQEIIGFVIGSISSILYLFSRLPQIHTNVSPSGGAAEGKRRAEWGL